MALIVFEYNPDKAKPEEKARAVDVMGVLESMSELEEYNGTTLEATHNNYYELKRQLRNAIYTEMPKEKK